MMGWTTFGLAVSLGQCVSALLTCQSQSQPNPIAAQYPNLTTGTINGTVAILPITYAQARSIIPSQYPILTHQYEAWLKGTGFPSGMFPAMLQAELDHDVQNSGVKIPDFSRVTISYPFIDRLNDGYTAMSYSSNILISPNVVAQVGAGLYGDAVSPATFQPPCDGYAYTAGSSTQTFFNATPVGSTTPGIAHQFSRVSQSPYSLDFYKNITNQPQFASDPLLCDNYIRLFNSSVTVAPYGVKPVLGRVSATTPFFAQTTTWTGVHGIQLDNAFIENNFMTCSTLKGYHATGNGD